MSISRRTVLAGLFATCAALPFAPVNACVDHSLSARILFDDVPPDLPDGMVAKHIHLVNSGPEFERYTEPMEFEIEGSGDDLKFFSFVGIGTFVNPWTYWFTKRLPEWVTGKPRFFPILAPVSSCTGGVIGEADMVELFVGNLMSQKNGEPVFVAASKRLSSDRWITQLGVIDKD
ncbi:hypothetical protein K3148_03660 [Qipengyuania aurantiaca]|uniref:Uncharacterized protein n=1 Tax=Qipengyuania aurantiaca TaxID=2867233 RepID=A0ABX8ZNG9_9SPHN|nr:hypothetical protein [Qipengyuania aurantiaca]QZD90501.1 hypothetical protein K3148_03660 [Qipengyuania aurantiaca]